MNKCQKRNGTHNRLAHPPSRPSNQRFSLEPPPHLLLSTPTFARARARNSKELTTMKAKPLYSAAFDIHNEDGPRHGCYGTAELLELLLEYMDERERKTGKPRHPLLEEFAEGSTATDEAKLTVFEEWMQYDGDEYAWSGTDDSISWHEVELPELAELEKERSRLDYLVKVLNEQSMSLWDRFQVVAQKTPEALRADIDEAMAMESAPYRKLFTKNGLLYWSDAASECITVLDADRLAVTRGFRCAEELVRVLDAQQKGGQ